MSIKIPDQSNREIGGLVNNAQLWHYCLFKTTPDTHFETVFTYLKMCVCKICHKHQPLSVQLSSVAQSCQTLCDPKNRSTLGLPVHHQLPAFTETHVHRGEGNGNPLQYSCLENPMGRGAWWAAVHGVSKSRTWLKWLSSSSMSIKSPTTLAIYEIHLIRIGTNRLPFWVTFTLPHSNEEGTSTVLNYLCYKKA